MPENARNQQQIISGKTADARANRANRLSAMMPTLRNRIITMSENVNEIAKTGAFFRDNSVRIR